MSLQQSHLRSRYRCSFIKSSSILKIEARVYRSSASSTIDNTGAPLAYSAGGDMSKLCYNACSLRLRVHHPRLESFAPPNTLADSEMIDKRA
ncbi:hypothetical protein HN011_010297 [Eciton burchellii]|nr:hypothetical protein HN011_010297 [Eciton burchellii]